MTADQRAQLGILRANELIDGPSEITLFDTVFPNFQKEDNGAITLPVALEVSSDTYFYQVGARFWNLHLERRGRTDNANTGLQQQDGPSASGSASTTGLDLPGEDPGRVPTPTWKAANFGYTHSDLLDDLDPRRQHQHGRRPGQPAGDAAADGRRLRGDRQRRQCRDADARDDGDQSQRRVVRQLSGVTPPRPLGINPADPGASSARACVW